MFGKRILSLLSLLFAGSQLISVANAGACTFDGTAISGGSCDGSSYLINSGKTVVTDTTTCISDSAVCTLVECPSTDGPCEKEDSYSGFVVVGSKLAKCTNGDCVTQNMFENGATKYLVRDIDDSLTNKGNTIAVTSNGTSLSLDTSLTADELCVSADTAQFTETSTEESRYDCFCGENTLYKCESGVCTTNLTLDCKRQTKTCDPTKDSTTDPNNNEQECVDGGYYLDTNTLYECKGETVQCTPQDGGSGHPAIPKGYFPNSGSDASTNPYIQCNGSTCVSLVKTTITKSGCGADGVKVGDLIFITGSGYRLCTASDKPVALSDNKKYLITLVDSTDNAFTNAADAGKAIIVDTTTTTAILNAVASNGNYIIGTNNDLVDTATSGSLVQCSDGTCVKPSLTGYFKNVETTHTEVPYISCEKGVCNGYKPGTEADCTSKNPGDIINPTGTNYVFCVKEGASKIEVPLTTGSNAKYMVGAKDSFDTNPFSAVALNGYYIVVDVSGTDVVVHTQDKKKYRYTDASQKIYDSKNDEGASASVCKNPGGTIVEYTIDSCADDDYDYYSQGTPKTWTL